MQSQVHLGQILVSIVLITTMKRTNMKMTKMNMKMTRMDLTMKKKMTKMKVQIWLQVNSKI